MQNQPVIMEEKPNNKNRNIMLIVAAVVVLGCFCVLAGVAGFYAFTTIRSETTVPVQPTEIITPLEEATPESDTGIGDPPSGGLGNDILRHDTWKVMAPAAVGRGCDQPLGAESTIEVLQQPDASGHWAEKWTVMCNSGESYTFQVDFTLDSTGTTFDIKSLP